MSRFGFLQKAWALTRRPVKRPAPDAHSREPLDARRDPDERSSGLPEHNTTSPILEASAPSPPEGANIEADAASLSSQVRLEPLAHAPGMNASLNVLAEQMLTLVEVVSAQEKDIKALKVHCQQLEEHDQAIMVAFTTFFHVLAAKRIARLEDIFAIFQNISETAEREAYPEGSIRLLQRLATMLREQSARAAE